MAEREDEARVIPVGLLGGLNLLALLAGAALSWVLAPFATYEERAWNQFTFFARIADSIPWLNVPDGARGGLSFIPWSIQTALRARGPFESRTAFLGTYSVSLLVSTVVTTLLVYLLWARRDRLTSATADRLAAWAPAFAIACVLAVPVLVPDFWLSVAWGRTLAAGINPYYEVPTSVASWIPLDPPIMRMTYGPLWAYVSTAVMWVVRGHALWGALLFKLLIGGAWVLAVRVVRDLVRDRTPLEQCLAVVMVAWIPISVTQTVAEGHNDIAMVLGVLLWMRWLLRGRLLLATVALTASVLFKYATAPLFLLDFLYRAPHDDRRLMRFIRAYLRRGLLATALVILAFAPLMRGLDFFGSTAEAHGGHFFLPSDVVFAIGHLTSLSLRPLAYLVEGLVPLVTLVFVWRYLRDGGTARLAETATAVMLSVLLVASGHVWPWYVLWLLAPAATVALSWTGRFTAGFALAMPFPLLVWTVSPSAPDFKKFWLPALIAYTLAVGWMAVTSRLARWRNQPVYGGVAVGH